MFPAEWIICVFAQIIYFYQLTQFWLRSASWSRISGKTAVMPWCYWLLNGTPQKVRRVDSELLHCLCACQPLARFRFSEMWPEHMQTMGWGCSWGISLTYYFHAFIQNLTSTDASQMVRTLFPMFINLFSPHTRCFDIVENMFLVIVWKKKKCNLNIPESRIIFSK